MSTPSDSPLFPSFPDLERHLHNLGLFRMVPGLERMHEALDRLGLRRPPYVVVQVAGTNGKGSTSTMLERLARAHGLRTGLHTSPHFISVRERVRVNGETLSEDLWTALSNRLMQSGGTQLSYFEFVTCLAVLAFAEAGVDIAIMETGLGGSWDATTALDADLLVFTPIDLDHQGVLGLSLAEIAADKAGAIRPGGLTISAAQRPEAWRQLRREARNKGAQLVEASGAIAPAPVAWNSIANPAKPHLPGPGAGPEAIATAMPTDDGGPTQAVREGSPHHATVPASEARKASPSPLPIVSPPTALDGPHQRANAHLALAAWRLLLDQAIIPQTPDSRSQHLPEVAPFPPSKPEQTGPSRSGALLGLSPTPREAQALSSAWLPGRMQRIAPRPDPVGGYRPCALGWPSLLLDGAHNSHGLAALGHGLAVSSTAPPVIIFSCLCDKDLDSMLPHLRVLATGLILVPPVADNPRAMAPEELARLIGLGAEPVRSLRAALERGAMDMSERLPEVFDPASEDAKRNPLLICGSLYLLGEFFSLRPDCLHYTLPPA